jgi:DNA polymerase-3 subunit delta'
MASGRACNQCAACNWFNSSNHPDFRLIEPDSLADNAGVEEGGEKRGGQRIRIERIRELPDFINISSHRGGRKVILLHPAESLNVNAANALLKSLEEPPAGTYFLLVAHRIHFLLPTIKSRCRRFALPAPEPRDAIEWLSSEGVKDPELALAQTGNAPLLAQQLTEQMYWEQRQHFLKRISDRELDALSLAEQIRDYPVLHIVSWLQKWTYDLVLDKTLGRVRYNPDYKEELDGLAGGIERLSALRFHRSTIRLQRVVDHPLNARLLFEQLLIDYADLVQTGTLRERDTV